MYLFRRVLYLLYKIFSLYILIQFSIQSTPTFSLFFIFSNTYTYQILINLLPIRIHHSVLFFPWRNTLLYLRGVFKSLFYINYIKPARLLFVRFFLCNHLLPRSPHQGSSSYHSNSYQQLGLILQDEVFCCLDEGHKGSRIQDTHGEIRQTHL